MKTVCRASVFGFLLFTFLPAKACPFCNSQTRQAIYNSQFYPNVVMMLSAFLILAVVIAALAFRSTKRHRAMLVKSSLQQGLNPVPLTTTAMILGIGIGGFFDGIVLHQILQWHEMLSNKIPPTDYLGKTVNMFWDGIFHAFTLLVVLVGIVLLWRLLHRNGINRSGYLLSSGLLTGWGLFNLVEGLLDHQLLKLHNVREIAVNKNVWNYGFLGLSFLLLLAGYGLKKRAKMAIQVRL